MKKIINATRYICFVFSVCVFFAACQKKDRPQLGDYPQDANAPGGPLKFYAAFDGTTDNPLFNAVDSIKANFAGANPLTSIPGVSGKAVQGEDGKAIKYNSANDFGSNISSFSISLWLKKAVTDNGYETVLALAHKDLYYRTALHFDVYPSSDGATVEKAPAYFYIEQPNGDYFEVYYTGANAIPGLLDDTWHHLVFTYDETNSEFKTYKDAVLINTSVWTGHGPIVLDNSKLIGLVIGGSNKHVELETDHSDWMTSWRGGIDQFRLYGKKVLTETEISTLYNSKL